MRSFLILLTLFALALSGCTREVAIRTALDVSSCAVREVADHAAPVMGEVAAIVLGNEPTETATAALKAIGVTAGLDAVLCALDRLIADLGGAALKGAVPSAAVSFGPPSEAARAAVRARALRASLAP